MSEGEAQALAKTRDMIHCARMNLENLGKAMPLLLLSPLYKIVHMQLSWALGEKSEYEPELPTPSDDPEAL